MRSRRFYKLLLPFIAAIPFTDIKADSTGGSALVINEIMPANVDMFLDPSFNYGSWIEIYNTGDADIDISGWYLSNDPADRTQCPLGNRSRVIKSKGFLTLWFGHVDSYCPDQIDFKLENSYDDPTQTSFVMLSDKDGNIRISESYPLIPTRISWARKTDGANEWGLTGYPTPTATNTTSQFATQQLPAPQVDVDSKLFTESFYIYVDIPEGVTLHYTVDCSLPVIGNPSLKTSSGGHTVDSTKVYRFRFYKDGMLPSPVVTRTYIKTANQYGVPVVSIVTANDNLYSTKYGIWAKGPNGLAGNGQTDLCNWNRDWDRPASFEVIDQSGTMILNQEVEICNAGRYSRSYEPHSLKIEVKKKYGYGNYLPFTPFSDKQYNKYKSLKIRNGGNSFQARFRDAAIQQVVLRSGVNLECQTYQPVHQYVNGVYKGVLNFRETNNKDYAYSNYGIDEEDVDFFKIDHKNGDTGHGYGYIQSQGTPDAWDEWFNLAKTANKEESYRRICQLVDVEEFANYMAIEFLLYNSDWPRNNVKVFRRRPDGQFRFILFDIDNILGFGANINDNPFTVFDGEEYRTVIVTLFHNMLKNSTFNKLFVDSYCIMAGSVLQPDYIKPIINKLGTRAAREMTFNNESPQSDINMILNNITATYLESKLYQIKSWSHITTTCFYPVKKTISSNLPHATLTLNGLPIPTGTFNGSVISESTVSAIAPAGYTFKEWRNSNGSTISTNPSYKLKNSMDETIKAIFVRNESIPRPVRINEVSAGNDIFINEDFKKHDWIELYNITDNTYDASGMYLSDNRDKPHKYRIPDGTVIPARGYLVIWCDKDNGTQLHANFKLENKETGYVMLTANDDSWTDSLAYCPHEDYQSVGLYPDGGNTSYVFNRPSIGTGNRHIYVDSLYNKTIVTWNTPIKENDRKEVIFNLLGQPVQEMQPGQIYIRNRKKFIYMP